MIFQDIQDLEDWLRPLDYVQFWDAVEPYGFSMQERDHCNELIAGGEVDPALIPGGLKFMAVLKLSASLNLKDRIREPISAQYLTNIH